MKIKSKVKKLFQSDSSKFALITGMKFSFIFIISILFSFYLIWLVMNLNYIFFEANGYLEIDELRQAYFDTLLTTSMNQAHYLGLFLCIVFFAGVYVSSLLIRPFSMIGRYCEKKLDGEDVSYFPDLFSDYKLLTRFSEFFFIRMDEFSKKGKLEISEIPAKFNQIHKPQFEKVFFFHFSLIVAIIIIITSTIVHIVNVEVYQSMINLSISVLKNHGNSVGKFLNKQSSILDNIQFVSALFTVTLYLLLAFNLYSRVGGAIFGFFSTMRSYVKGDYNARVHLLGYNHIRPYGRSLNKYLKYLQREYVKNDK